MIRYAKGSEVGVDPVYEAFSIGFSDYMVAMDISREAFAKRFFGPEGNDLNHSHIALEDGKPIGVVLGGVKMYEGVKTMRCGALAVHPEFRKRGVGLRLMEVHREEAVRLGCGQLFLEVIAGNDRAIALYEQLGYEKVYELEYFTLQDIGVLERFRTDGALFGSAGIEQLRAIRRRLADVHVNWQNDVEYIEQSDECLLYGAYREGRLIGLICLHPAGRIKFLWVDDAHRRQGIGTGLLQKAVSELGLAKLHLSMSGNASLRAFALNLGFCKDALFQYEMYNRISGTDLAAK